MRAYRAATVAVAMTMVVGSGSGAAAAHVAGWTSLLTVSTTGSRPDGLNQQPIISGDGRYVAFASSSSNLVASDTNGFTDVFVRDVRTGTTSRVSVIGSGGQANGGDSEAPTISADGRYVAFVSYATNMPGGVNRTGTVFVRDRLSGTTVRVVPPAANSASDFPVGEPKISADGRYVAVTTRRGLDPGDTNDTWDIYVWARATGALERVSVTDSGSPGNDESSMTSISGDGRYVAFASGASNLVPGDVNGAWDLFVRDRLARTTTRPVASNTGSVSSPRITPDGRYVAFYSEATDLVPRDPTVGWRFASFVHDRTTGVTSLVSISPTGSQLSQDAVAPVISADGRWVAFFSHYGGHDEVFLRDRRAGTTVIASVSTAGHPSDDHSYWPAISADGRRVAFLSRATTLVRAAPDSTEGIYLRDYRR